MKRLVCEMCGGTDLLKQDGVFVCQNCGTKYSVEDAKKMMVEGTVSVEGVVSVEGTVKVDKSEELKNLLVLARRAKEMDNDENACKYYNEIVLKDPNNWEANFYSVFFKAVNCRKGEIGYEARNVANCLKSSIRLLVDAVGTGDEAKKNIAEIKDKLEKLTIMMLNAVGINGDFYTIVEVKKMKEELEECLAEYPEFKELTNVKTSSKTKNNSDEEGSTSNVFRAIFIGVIACIIILVAVFASI